MIRLPYPITHLHELLSTSEEWHNLIIGMCVPAIKIWRIKTDISLPKKELHYYLAGLMLSTMLFGGALAAFIFLMVHYG